MTRAERERLDDTGIAGTKICYAFSFDVAHWLARKCPGRVSIDWNAIDDTSRLDELVQQLIRPAEDEYFDSGYVSTREWMDLARFNCMGTDFDWLLAQLRSKRPQTVWRQLYDAADIPLIWDLADCRFSKSRNALPVRRPVIRADGLRPRPRRPKRTIIKLLDTRLLSPREGARLIDMAMASLAVRHRETFHFNYANPKEVYEAEVGGGVTIAVFGLLPEHRYPLECTMGFLILANGMPVGYGGSSIVFRQVNSGINIFDEYRGSEAAYLWTQVMRVYHALVGSTRFIANAYQFGEDNSEALQSGAFWFYYRLGFRPVRVDVRRLAAREARRIRRNRNHRSDRATLRRLASCDMHLVLPGAKPPELFDEEWLTTSSMLATKVIAQAAGNTHEASEEIVAAQLAKDLSIRNFSRWTVAEREAFRRIAPFATITRPTCWSAEERRALRELLRAKGEARELDFARKLFRHTKFLKSLRNVCRLQSNQG